MLTPILAYRLQHVVTTMVDVDQVGFIWGRKGFDNLRLVTDMMAHISDKPKIIRAFPTPYINSKRFKYPI